MCEVNVDGRKLYHVTVFKYLRFILGELGRYRAECCREIANGKKWYLMEGER